MEHFRPLSLFLLVCVLTACEKPLPTLDDVDLQRWQQDKNACDDTRASTLQALEEQKDKLLSLDQMQIVSLLGKPDQNELSRRNEKFFYYFIDPAPNCPTPARTARRLVVRFNAVGLAKEVIVVDGGNVD